MDALLTTDYALLAADWRQTQHIVESCHEGGGYHEINPLLGRCPSMARLNAGVALSGGAVATLANTLPEPYRKAFLKGYAGFEFSFVAHNWTIGLHFTH